MTKTIIIFAVALAGACTSPANENDQDAGAQASISIVDMTPSHDSSQVDVSVIAEALLSGPIDPQSVDARSVIIWHVATGDKLPRRATYDPETATIRVEPMTPLGYADDYGFTIVGLRDFGGNVVPTREAMFTTVAR